MTRAIDKRLSDLEKRQGMGSDEPCFLVKAPDMTREDLDRQIEELRAKGHRGVIWTIDAPDEIR